MVRDRKRDQNDSVRGLYDATLSQPNQPSNGKGLVIYNENAHHKWMLKPSELPENLLSLREQFKGAKYENLNYH